MTGNEPTHVSVPWEGNRRGERAESSIFKNKEDGVIKIVIYNE